MRQTHLFTKTIKQPPRDEVSRNAQLLTQAGFIDKLMAGVYTLLPLGLKVFKKIEAIIRQEIEAIGGVEIKMPALQPQKIWEQTGRWQTVDDLYKLPLGNGRYLALGPTHEEVITPLAKKIIFSYKDLPVYLYQFQDKFRQEKRAKSGLLRGREFVMKDLYSFHADQADLDKFYEKAKQAYLNIFNRCGLGGLTYLTYASGGTFSKYSHEFQALTEAGEDIIYICDNCQIAINEEIIAEQNHACPECGSTQLRSAKAVEVGNIFKLGTKFSKPFNLTYTDKAGQQQLVVMGCYGIGLQRLMGTVVEVSNDSQGIIWPEAIAPFKVHLLALGNENSVFSAAGKLYEQMQSNGLEVLFDDRRQITAGIKLNEADLIGCPYRVVVSEKTLAQGQAEVKRRRQPEVKMVSLNKAAEIKF